LWSGLVIAETLRSQQAGFRRNSRGSRVAEKILGYTFKLSANRKRKSWLKTGRSLLATSKCSTAVDALGAGKAG